MGLQRRTTEYNRESENENRVQLSVGDTHSWSWALLKKLPIVQLLKNFPAFYRTRRFITVFTRALHWSLSWARSIQSIPSYLSKVHLILSTHLRLVCLVFSFLLWRLSVWLEDLVKWDSFNSVTRIRLVKTGNPNVCVTVNCKLYISAKALYCLLSTSHWKRW
jgi:hypothetical protein